MRAHGLNMTGRPGIANAILRKNKKSVSSRSLFVVTVISVTPATVFHLSLFWAPFPSCGRRSPSEIGGGPKCLLSASEQEGFGPDGGSHEYFTILLRNLCPGTGVESSHSASASSLGPAPGFVLISQVLSFILAV